MKNVLILSGGRSTEHKISLISAQSVSQNIDRTKYKVHCVAIDVDGVWYYHGSQFLLKNSDKADRVEIADKNRRVIFTQNPDRVSLLEESSLSSVATIEILFPVLHGKYGEDGSIQGMAAMAGIPCVGPSIMSAANTMDKDVTKRILRDADIAVAPFITIRKGDPSYPSYQETSKSLGDVLFIKPVRLGSSVGVVRATDQESYDKAIAEGFMLDDKIIVESEIKGREIECAVKGNVQVQASAIGEIRPTHGVYDFESKYLDEDGAALMIPAPLSESDALRAQNFAIETYKALDCKGMARVDMFLTESGDLILNEVNTIPGFTQISMYPKLWAYSGTPYTDLLTELIEYAEELG